MTLERQDPVLSRLTRPPHSQQKLADIANVEQSTSKRIELSQLAPTLDLLISLSRALALEVRDLVDDPAITNSDPEV